MRRLFGVPRGERERAQFIRALEDEALPVETEHLPLHEEINMHEVHEVHEEVPTGNVDFGAAAGSASGAAGAEGYSEHCEVQETSFTCPPSSTRSPYMIRGKKNK